MALSSSLKNKLLDRLIDILKSKISTTFYAFEELVVILAYDFPDSNVSEVELYAKELIDRKIFRIEEDENHGHVFKTTIADLNREKRILKLKIINND